jgi:hypothetical protein
MSDEAEASKQVGPQARAWEPALVSFRGNFRTPSKALSPSLPSSLFSYTPVSLSPLTRRQVLRAAGCHTLPGTPGTQGLVHREQVGLVQALRDKIEIPGGSDRRTTLLTALKIEPVQSGATQGKDSLTLLVTHRHGLIRAVRRTGATGDAFFRGEPEVTDAGMIEIQVTQLQGIHTHLVPANFHAMAAAAADVASEASSGFFPHRIF